MLDFKELVTKLGLQKHPEGGYFRENYRSQQILDGVALGWNIKVSRSLATSIYFLLPSGEVSRWHRLTLR